MPLVEPPADQPVFYMTVNSNRKQLRPLVRDGQRPVMRNVMQFRRSGSLSVRDIYAGRYVLDSGGYTAMQEFGGDFPWSVTEYHEWAAEMYDRQPFDWVAVMDLACEPDFDHVVSVEERINRTVENTIALLNHDPDYPVLPVLQGRTVEDWLDCYDRLRDHGIDPDYVGVGTLCRQTSGQAIHRISRALRTRTDIDAFHGFGVKATAFKQGAMFESADSQAWTWPNTYGIQLSLVDGDPPTLKREPYGDSDTNIHHNNFKAYYEHATRLQQEAYSADGWEQREISEWFG